MSDGEEDVEGEGEEKKEEPRVPKVPSQVQIKLGEQGRYVAGKFDLIFSMLLKIEVNSQLYLHSILRNQIFLIMH